MRIFLFALCFCIPICCFPQFFDDFSKNDWNSNSAWKGKTSCFTVNERSHLQLSDPGNSGIAWIYTPLSANTAHTFEWEFRCILRFNPSRYNFARIYLSADNGDFSLPLTGYYVLLGGTSDEVALFRQEGDNHTRITGVEGCLDNNRSDATIRVKYTPDTGWVLNVSLSDGTGSYRAASTSTALFPDSFVFGPSCHYTKTYSEKFEFDYFSFASSDNSGTTDPDIRPDSIYIDTLICVSPDLIRIRFNAPISLQEAWVGLSEDGYLLESELEDDQTTIRAIVSPRLIENAPMLLLISNLFDTYGNRLNPFVHPFTVPYFPTIPDPDPEIPDPEEPDVSDDFTSSALLITEIMANPGDNTSLPDVEYVEIYNNTETTLSLKDVRFFYASKRFLLPEFNLHPDSYAILCHSNKAHLFSSDIPVVPVASFPVLANTGKLLYLESPEGQLLDWVEYDGKWYADSQKTKGYSLERIDLDNRFPSAANWIASVDLSGGTPGAPNSVCERNPDTSSPYVASYRFDASARLHISFSKPMNGSLTQSFDWLEIPQGLLLDSVQSDYPAYRDFRIFCSGYHEQYDVFRIDSLLAECVSSRSLVGNTVLAVESPSSSLVDGLVINEILFSPSSRTGIFVELYNGSSQVVDASSLYLALEASGGSIGTAYALAPAPHPILRDRYALISLNPALLFDEYGCFGSPHILTPTSLPAIKPDKGILLLLDSEKNILDRIPFSAAMLTDGQGVTDGVSLERVSTSMSSGEWKPAKQSAGYATPGYRNSVISESKPDPILPDTDWSGFRLGFRKVSLSDSADGCIVLEYSLDTPTTLHAAIYDASGIEKARLASGESLEGFGSLSWDREWRQNGIQSPGIYILRIEWRNNQGRINHEKLVFPVVP